MNHESLIETVCSIGDVLLETLQSNEPTYRLIKAIYEARPTTDYPFTPSTDYLANELELLDDELEDLLKRLKKRLTGLFMKDDKVEVSQLPFFNVPETGSAFIFQINEHQTLSVKTNHLITLNIGDEVFPYYFREEMGDSFYKVDYKVVEMGFNGIVTIYFLSKLE